MQGVGVAQLVNEASKPQDEMGRPRTAGSLALSDAFFYIALSVIGAAYILLVLSMLIADGVYMISQTVRAAAQSPQPWLAMLKAEP